MKKHIIKSLIDLIKDVFIKSQVKSFKINEKFDETPLEKKLEK